MHKNLQFVYLDSTRQRPDAKSIYIYSSIKTSRMKKFSLSFRNIVDDFKLRHLSLRPEHSLIIIIIIIITAKSEYTVIHFWSIWPWDTTQKNE